MTMRSRHSPKDRIGHDGRMIVYEIVHRPAVTRRIHLEIGENGALRVVAPQKMSRRAINRALQQRAHHVDRFLVEARARQRDLPELRYVNGEEHLLLGRAYPLDVRLQPGKRGHVALGDEGIQMKTPDDRTPVVKRQLLRWYRQQAQQYFTQRLIAISQEAPWLGGAVPPTRLRRMKRSWGNCSSRGLITLNPHLIKAPPALIDYVIAHETCHLREHNHGKAFYALLQQLHPAWREARAQLKSKGHIYLHD